MPRLSTGTLLFTICILTFIVVFPSSFSSLTREGSINQRDPYESFSSEVLLNRESISYDMSILDEYVDEGQMEYFEVGQPGSILIEEIYDGEETSDQEEEETGYDFPPGVYYLFASHLDPRIAVVLSEVDDTMMAQPIFPGMSLKGLSVSIVAPSKMETFTIDTKIGKAELETPLLLNETVSYFMEERGYFTYSLRDGDGVPVGFGMLNGTSEIYIYNSTSEETSWTGMSSGIAVRIDVGLPTDKIDSDIRGLLSALGLNSSLWTVSYTSGSRYSERLAPDIEENIEDLDWDILMSTELKWLMDKGIVDGLSEMEVADISSLANPGVAGINYRIIYDDDEWKTFDEIGNIPFLGTGFEQTGTVSRFNMQRGDLPVPADLDGQDSNLKMVLAIVLSITFGTVAGLLGLTYYARHKRSELLDNLNRKHLYEIISSKPGIHFSELQRELDLKQGVLSYHLNVLEKNEMVKSVQDGTFRRFYLFDEKIKFEFRLHEMQKQILFIISKKPGITQSNISKTLGRNRMVVNYHLKILLETGILHLEREGRETHCYITDAGYMFQGA